MLSDNPKIRVYRGVHILESASPYWRYEAKTGYCRLYASTLVGIKQLIKDALA